MKDCFVKTLAGELDNNNLPVYGKIKIKVNSVGTTSPITFYGPVTLEIVGNGYFVTSDPGEGHWSDGTNKDTTNRADGKYRVYQGGNHPILVSAGEYELLIYNKYAPSQYFNLISIPAYCCVDINDFDYSIYNTNSTNARINSFASVHNTKTKGNVAQLLRHSNMNDGAALIIQLYGTSVTLNLEELLGDDITCAISKLYLQNCPNVTGKDAATLAAVRAKFTGIDLVV